MSSLERRKLCCSITFHLVAITCVIWSLYVLIERTTEEIEEGDLQWPFWTKLIVVAIGFTGITVSLLAPHSREGSAPLQVLTKHLVGKISYAN